MKKVTLSILAGAACAFLTAIPAMAANDSNQRWPAETLGGAITLVEPAQHVVVVQTAGKVPFDMLITPKTRIMHNNQILSMRDLQQYKDSHVTVQFIPEGRGDVARVLRING